MQQTQKQSAHSARVCEIRSYLPKVIEQIDQLIDGYTVMKKLRPSFARQYLSDIEDAIRWLRYNERELASLEANPDCPF